MKRSAKILIAINSLAYGGAERVVTDQINELVKRGYDVSLVAVVPTVKKSFWEEVDLPENKKSLLRAPFFNLASLLTCVKFLRQERPDILITHLFLTNTLMRLASLFLWRRPKIICYEHNEYWQEKKKKHLWVDRLLALFTDKIIAVSPGVLAYLVAQKVSQRKLVLLQNGISFAFRNKLRAVDEVRAELGMTKDDFLVVAVGNVNYQKGHDILIEAMSWLVPKQPGFKCFVCGADKSDFALALKEKIKALGLEKNVKLLGSRADIHDIVSAADVFCLPSRWEGLSIALLEAIGLGQMIVVSDIGSFSSIIKDRVSGLLFKSENSNDLAQALKTVYQNEELVRVCRRNVSQLASRFSIEKNVDDLISIIFS